MNTNIEIPDVNNPAPTRILTPMPNIKPAANYIESTYGGMQEIDASAMRQNYIARLTNVLNDKSNEKGLSSGGGNYVQCLYDTVNTTAKDPYACGGYKKYKDSYGDSAKGCVVSYDEY
jgi:hypothetical protein